MGLGDSAHNFATIDDSLLLAVSRMKHWKDCFPAAFPEPDVSSEDEDESDSG